MIYSIIPQLSILIIKNENSNERKDNLYYLNLIYILKQQIEIIIKYDTDGDSNLIIKIQNKRVKEHILKSYENFLKVHNEIALKNSFDLHYIIMG